MDSELDYWAEKDVCLDFESLTGGIPEGMAHEALWVLTDSEGIDTTRRGILRIYTTRL